MSESKQTSSFLLRVWLEPGAGEGAESAVRGYLRNLQTGEEQYIGGAEALTAVIRSQVRPEIYELSEERSAESRGEASKSRRDSA